MFPIVEAGSPALEGTSLPALSWRETGCICASGACSDSPRPRSTGSPIFRAARRFLTTDSRSSQRS